MDDNTLVIIGLAIMTGSWIAIQLAEANKIVMKAYLPDTWQIVDGRDRGSDSSSVPDFSARNSQIQKQSEGKFQGGI